MSDSQGINSLEEVQKIYTDVSEWLKFLEAKHAGLFAVWTALLIAVITSEINESISMALYVSIIIIIIIGIGINALALSPFTNRIVFIKKACYKKYKSINSDNVIFYQTVFIKTYSETGDMNYSINKYKNILHLKGINDIENNLVKDYLSQIISVSIVGSIKAYLFTLATKYIFLIMGIIIIALIIA